MKRIFVILVVSFCLLSYACDQKESVKATISWSKVPIDSTYVASEDIEKVIGPYRQALDSIMDEVIGHAAHDLNTQGAYESTLGTFVTRLSLTQCEEIFGREVDVSVMNHHGGLRASINEGDITLGEVYQVMPFENEMLLLEVPGDVLLEVIEKISKRGSSMIWPVTFDQTKEGPINIQLNDQAISPTKNYVMAISDYLANGGSGFAMLKSVKRLEVSPVKLRDIIVKEIREKTERGESIHVSIAHHIQVIE